METDIEHIVLSFSFNLCLEMKSFQTLVIYNTYCSNNFILWNLVQKKTVFPSSPIGIIIKMYTSELLYWEAQSSNLELKEITIASNKYKWVQLIL